MKVICPVCHGTQKIYLINGFIDCRNCEEGWMTISDELFYSNIKQPLFLNELNVRWTHPYSD